MSTPTVYKFTHTGDLLSLNQALNLAKNPKGSKFLLPKKKEKAEEAIIWSIKRQLPGVKITEPWLTVCTWFVKNRATDPDNRASAIKYLLDGAQKAGLIPNDNYKLMSGGIVHRFKVSPDKINRVEVAFVLGATINIPGIADAHTDQNNLQLWYE
jgi:Holliday junction resolvase RusA-like endonuclease